MGRMQGFSIERHLCNNAEDGFKNYLMLLGPTYNRQFEETYHLISNFNLREVKEPNGLGEIEDLIYSIGDKEVVWYYDSEEDCYQYNYWLD